MSDQTNSEPIGECFMCSGTRGRDGCPHHGPRATPLTPESALGIDSVAARHAELLAILTEIRDAVRELRGPGQTPNPLASAFESLRSLATVGANLAPLKAPALAEWRGEFTAVGGAPHLLRTAGLLWRWMPGLRAVIGPLCPAFEEVVGAHDPHELRYQSSSGLPPGPVTDSVSLGPLGWLWCPLCDKTYAVPGLVTVGAIREKVDAAFRTRLGLPARGA